MSAGPEAEPEARSEGAGSLPGSQDGTAAGQWHLLGRLAVLERRIHRMVAPDSAASQDAAAGVWEQMYVSQDEVVRLLQEPSVWPVGPDADERRLLQRVEEAADAAEAAGHRLPLRDLARAFALTEQDVAILLVALAPHLDSRYERFYGYLNHGAAGCHATVDTALRLTGQPAASGAVRSRITSGPAARYGLWKLADEDRPFLTRSLQAADRVVAHLLAQDVTDPTITALVSSPVLRPLETASLRGHTDRLETALAGQQVVYLRGPETHQADGITADQALNALTGTAPLTVDLSLLAREADPAGILIAIAREAKLRDHGLRAGPVEALGEEAARLLPLLIRLCEPLTPLVLTGGIPWRLGWSPVPVQEMDPPAWTSAERAQAWRQALGDPAVVLEEHESVVQAMAPYSLGPQDITRAVESARVRAEIDRVPLDARLLQAAARRQYASDFGRLARRIRPAATWDDLVVPETVLTQLHDLTRRARFREHVLTAWRMRPGDGRGHSVCALFTGGSGTGKTLAAEVVAADIGLDLYVINLATVVDKYIGETEKNLERLFTTAEQANAVLFFDEADAIFGKRSETKDAHDRYANIETAYLLQRLERYDGVAILASNLFTNIDQAFIRRFDMITHFPKPDENLRRELWDRCLGHDVPRDDGLDLEHLARTFDLAGGDIRCCTTTAAYQAAETNQPITTHTLLQAIRHEYTKIGRLVDTEKFTPPPEPRQDSRRVGQLDG
ncbi:ATP-binding protein [Streptomyces formicae]|uniref:ATP-binding protein n=1 Tax=Streptomyces formicae TaxID=1616117 RepID=UPI003614C6B8